MAVYIDRALGVLLMLGCVGHSLGSIKSYSTQPMPLLWALCASVLVALLGSMNLLRSYRPADRALAWLTCAGTFCWLVAAVVFGNLIGNVLDLRVIVFTLLCIGLIGFGLRTALNPAK